MDERDDVTGEVPIDPSVQSADREGSAEEKGKAERTNDRLSHLIEI
jgi:hypothetical protein